MYGNPRRWFTLDEANRILPALEKVLERLDAKVKASEKMHDHLLMEDLLHQATGKMDETSFQEDQQRLDDTIHAMAEELQEINSFGCKVSDLSKGLIDFPAKLEGNSVFYVWKRGEAEIRFYRSFQDKETLLPI